jgi:hypothetical protein
VESQNADTPDDPFAGQVGCCPHCGASFPSPRGVGVTTGVYGYAVELAGGRAGVESGTIFMGRCGVCHTELWSAGEGCREWVEHDPGKVTWHRNRNPIFGR